MIEKMEGEVAKSDAKTAAAMRKVAVAEGRLVGAEQTLNMMRGDGAAEEANVAQIMRKVANLGLTVREQQDTINFILQNLEDQELAVSKNDQFCI